MSPGSVKETVFAFGRQEKSTQVSELFGGEAFAFKKLLCLGNHLLILVFGGHVLPDLQEVVFGSE